MKFWLWNAGLRADALKQQVLLGVLERANAAAAGPTCSLFADVWGFDRRRGPDRRHMNVGWPDEHGSWPVATSSGGKD